MSSTNGYLVAKTCRHCKVERPVSDFYKQRSAKATRHGTFSLHIDHDHETGKVRALLCHACNKGLGQFGDSIERLEQAIVYLKQHKMVGV